MHACVRCEVLKWRAGCACYCNSCVCVYVGGGGAPQCSSAHTCPGCSAWTGSSTQWSAWIDPGFSVRHANLCPGADLGAASASAAALAAICACARTARGLALSAARRERFLLVEPQRASLPALFASNISLRNAQRDRLRKCDLPIIVFGWV